MPRSRGWQDYIPTSGEGRALVEVKGRVGGKGGRMYRRSRWNRIRNPIKNAQEWGVPLFPGAVDASANEWAHIFLNTLGSLVKTRPNAGLVFAITPETVGNGSTAPFPMIGEQSTAERLRVVGFQGELFWSPLDTLADARTPESMMGYIYVALVKLHAQNRVQTAGGTAAGGPYYPWQNFDPDGTQDTGSNTNNEMWAGYVPTFSALTSSQVLGGDGRFNGSIMWGRTYPWKINAMPIYNSLDESTSLVTVPSDPVRIALPRKVVCDVGRKECLALIFQTRSLSDVNSATSPIGRFYAPRLRVKTVEL